MEMNTVQLYINTSEEKLTEQGHLRNMHDNNKVEVFISNFQIISLSKVYKM